MDEYIPKKSEQCWNGKVRLNKVGREGNVGTYRESIWFIRDGWILLKYNTNGSESIVSIFHIITYFVHFRNSMRERLLSFHVCHHEMKF